MITINPVKLNNPVHFGDTNPILALQAPNAKQNFKENYYAAIKADAVQNKNPLDVIGRKIAKTYKLIFPEKPETKPAEDFNLKNYYYLA